MRVRVGTHAPPPRMMRPVLRECNRRPFSPVQGICSEISNIAAVVENLIAIPRSNQKGTLILAYRNRQLAARLRRRRSHRNIEYHILRVGDCTSRTAIKNKAPATILLKSRRRHTRKKKITTRPWNVRRKNGDVPEQRGRGHRVGEHGEGGANKSAGSFGIHRGIAAKRLHRKCMRIWEAA